MWINRFWQVVGLSVLSSFAISTTQAAVLQTGYIMGSGSQLLSANGGGGDILFVDSAATGGENDPNFPNGNEPFASVLLPGTGFWNIGDTVSITGVAFVIRGNTVDGTFTLQIREGAGGTGASGAAGLDPIGAATASYVDTSTAVHYVNFDTPVTFVADANSTTLGINIANTGLFGLKAWNNNVPGDRLAQYNYANGNLVGKFLTFSVAGTVTPIPEPSAFGLMWGAGALCVYVCRRRRR